MKDKYFFPVLLVLVLIYSRPAYAYIDPGTGSMVFQAIAASVLGLGYAVKLSYGHIKGFFAKNKNKDK